MRFKVEYNPDFYDDIEKAVDFNNNRRNGWGDKLFLIVKKQTASLSKSALSFGIKYDDIRCMPVNKFPYLVHYRATIQTKTVKVEALIHTSRGPEVWKEKIDS
jgi:hypothetical protein